GHYHQLQHQPGAAGPEGDQRHARGHRHQRGGRGHPEIERIGGRVEVAGGGIALAAVPRHEQARQEEQAREPQDHRRDMQDLQPEVHRASPTECGQCPAVHAKRPWWRPCMAGRAAWTRALALAGGLMVPAGGALAHAGHDHPPTLATAFSPSPWLLLPLTAWMLLYAVGLRRLWGRAGTGAGVTLAGLAAAVAGVVVLLLSTTWPLDAYGEWSLAAHIAQHMLIIAFV